MSLSSVLRKRLQLIARGREAQHAERLSMATIALDGMLERRGLVRTVKHRDHTRSYALTPSGRAALTEAAASSPCRCPMLGPWCERCCPPDDPGRTISTRSDP